MPADKIVVEVLETVGTDDAVVDVCRRLHDRGYQLALDDYVDDPSFDALLSIARIVKIDVLNRDTRELAPLLARLRPFKVHLLAERVETRRVHDECVELGFDMFQGYFYQRPELVTRQEIEVNHAPMLRLLEMLRDPDCSEGDVERGFRADPALAYKLLRIVNSAAVGGHGIDSIAHGIRIVGRQMLYRWLALLMVSSMVMGESDVNDQLVYAALLRARMCELIAESSPMVRQPQALFITGLFSMLDALLRIPMREVFSRVNIASDIREAVLDGTGPCSAPLLLAQAYQRGEWDRVDDIATSLGIQPAQLPWLYTKSLAWVTQQLTAASATE